MSSLKQNIRSVLADVETFLVETLKSVKLNSSAKDHKDRLLEKIRQLLDEIPGSASSYQDSNASGGSLKISGGGDSGSGGTSSSNLQTLGDEDPNYSSNIAKIAVADLKNKLQSGMLDKKKKSGFKSWEPFYCVVSGNIFYLYKKQGDSKQKEAFCLNGYEFQEAPGIEKDASRKDMCFELVQAGEPTYQFRAGSKEGMVIWREAITKGIQIAADEEPGADNYDDLAQNPADSHQYGTIEKISAYEIEEEVYDDLDNIQTPLPPVPRPNSLPQQKKPDAGSGYYANMLSNAHSPAEQKPKTAAVKGTSSSTKPPSEIHILKQNNSEVKKETAKTADRIPATNRANPKSPPGNPNKGRNLPAVPSELSPKTSDNKTSETKSQEVQRGGRRSPSPPASDDSTIPQGPGVKNLMKMFQQ